MSIKIPKCWIDEGKREAEEALEKQVSVKKQKRDEGVERAVKKQKVELKIRTKKKKKEESSSSDDSSSESEEETKVCCSLFFFSSVCIIFCA